MPCGSLGLSLADSSSSSLLGFSTSNSRILVSYTHLRLVYIYSHAWPCQKQASTAHFPPLLVCVQSLRRDRLARTTTLPSNIYLWCLCILLRSTALRAHSD